MFYRPYVPVATRRREASREVARIVADAGRKPDPVAIEGREIARSFWGKAWCTHLEAHCDFENRLPRGRTYVRNGSVMDLELREGRILALVSGSELYVVVVEVKPLAPARFRALVERCASSVGSVVELLEGRIATEVATRLVDPKAGLLPAAHELALSCSCPDWARMCKHVAAVLYGVGSRLDRQPELLFRLRSVDAAELAQRGTKVVAAGAGEAELPRDRLASIFGIELAPPPRPVAREDGGGYTFAVRREGRRGAPRQVSLPATATMLELAEAIRASFGHDDGALWGFYLSGEAYDAATEYGPPGTDAPHEADVPLAHVRLPDRFAYVHDFEADLRHRVEVRRRPARGKRRS